MLKFCFRSLLRIEIVTSFQICKLTPNIDFMLSDTKQEVISSSSLRCVTRGSKNSALTQYLHVIIKAKYDS